MHRQIQMTLEQMRIQTLQLLEAAGLEQVIKYGRTKVM